MIADFKELTIPQINSIYELIEDKEEAGYLLGKIINNKTRTAREKLGGKKNFAFLEVEKAQEFVFTKYPNEMAKLFAESEK